MQTTTPANVIDLESLPPLIEPKKAEALGMGSRRNICRMCEAGTIKAVRVGQRWRINTEAALRQFGLID
jgi:excisionase family DNA binding protein